MERREAIEGIRIEKEKQRRKDKMQWVSINVRRRVNWRKEESGKKRKSSKSRDRHEVRKVRTERNGVKIKEEVTRPT